MTTFHCRVNEDGSISCSGEETAVEIAKELVRRKKSGADHPEGITAPERASRGIESPQAGGKSSRP